MGMNYVTFGQGQAHHTEGKVLHPNVVARYETDNPEQGRAKAFKLFGPKFCFHYFGDEWNESDMVYYPEGYVDMS